MMLERAPIIGPGSIDVSDDQNWATRQAHWAGLNSRIRARRRFAPCDPLIIAGHGASLRVEHGTLLVRNGRTHHPQPREEHRFFEGDRALPSRIIVLDGSGLLSFDVLTWLGEQRIPLIRIDWRGAATCIVGGGGSALLADKVAWQNNTRADPQTRLEFASDLIAEKLAGTLRVLCRCLPPSRERDDAIRLAERTIDRLRARAVVNCAALLLVEARAAAAYFRAWKSLPIRWKRTASRPVPENWRRFDGRRSRRLNATSNRNATHPINALLNYGYAIVHSQVQLDLIGEGFDPSRGILHESRPDAMAAVLDFMEPRRPEIDALVLGFVDSNDFQADDFSLRIDGVCRVSLGLARALTLAATRH